MNAKKLAVELVEQIVTGSKDPKATAEIIVDRLIEEGWLILGYGDKDVELIVQTFSETFGNTKTSKYDRWAANRLADKYGSQAMRGIIQMLAQHSREKYVPVVGSVAQLEEKIVSVISFLRKLDKEEIDA